MTSWPLFVMLGHDGECQGSCRLNYVMIPPIDEAAVVAAQMSEVADPRLGDERATVLTAEKVRCSPSSPCSRANALCAWLRVAPRLPSPALRAVARALPGRDGKAGSPIEPESWICDVAARTTASRSGLRVTTPTGVQLRVCALQRRGLRSRASRSP